MTCFNSTVDALLCVAFEVYMIKNTCILGIITVTVFSKENILELNKMSANDNISLPATSAPPSPPILDPIVPIEEDTSLAPSGLTNSDVDHARTILNQLDSYDGTIAECREKLQNLGVHPLMSADPAPILVKSYDENDNSDEEEKRNREAEFSLRADELIGEMVNWNDMREEIIESDHISHPEPPTSTRIQEDPAQLMMQNDIPDDWKQFLISNLSLLYTSLKQGIDTTLEANHEIKAAVHNLTMDVKMIRDVQVKIGAKLSEVSMQLATLHKTTSDGQCDIQEMRQELSICTTGFSKINSALLQLNTNNIPQGKIPSAANYQFEMNPTVASVKDGVRTTPLFLDKKEVTEHISQLPFPSDKIPIIVSMLENRTARSFAMLLPQLNSAATISDPEARLLIEMMDIPNHDVLRKATACLYRLCVKKSGKTSSQDPGFSGIQQSSVSTETPTTVAKRQGTTRVKRCENPFASTSK